MSEKRREVYAEIEFLTNNELEIHYRQVFSWALYLKKAAINQITSGFFVSEKRREVYAEIEFLTNNELEIHYRQVFLLSGLSS